MRTRIFAAAFGLVLGPCGPALGQDALTFSNAVSWHGELVVAVGDLFDAPGGNLIGRLEDDQRKMKVDRWEGNWALVTGEGEPRIGWIERKSVKRSLQFIMFPFVRQRQDSPPPD